MKFAHATAFLLLLPVAAAHAVNEDSTGTVAQALEGEPVSMIPEPRLLGLLAWTVAIILLRGRLRR